VYPGADIKGRKVVKGSHVATERKVHFIVDHYTSVVTNGDDYFPDIYQLFLVIFFLIYKNGTYCVLLVSLRDIGRHL
jgi:hypothetical protein